MKRCLPIKAELLLLLLFFSAGLCVPQQVQAQNPASGQASQAYTVKGKVRDEEGNPLPGVSVKVKNTTRAVVTDSLGNYAIKVGAPTAVLQFSSIGYAAREEKVSARIQVNITLAPDAAALDDVVVVGYGTVKRKDVTGSVGKVDIEDLSKAPVRSFEEALAGRVAGVQVTSPEGQPGAASEIVIRGNNSLTQENSPLYVIDGFPMENPNNNVLNPADIESMEVLKDASATAIYGARGSNGVIIITTKKGKAGTPVFSYDGYYGMQSTIKRAKLMGAYEFVRYQLELDPVGKTDTYLSNGKTLEDYRNAPSIDWQDKLFRNAPMQNHNISLRGGNEQTKYALSGSVMNQDGIIINSGFRRYQGRFSLDQTVKKGIKLGMNANYAATRTSGTTPSTYNGNAGSLSLLYSTWGYRPVSGANVALEDLEDLPMDPDVDGNSDYRYNPVLSAQNELNNLYENTLVANAFTQITVARNLNLRISGGITRQERKREVFNNSKTKYGDINGAQGTRGPNGRIDHYERTDLLNENTLTYNKIFNKAHSLNVVAGFTTQKTKLITSYFQASGVPNESLGISGLEEGTPLNLGSTSSENFLASMLGRINYGYKSRYLFTLSFRSDGSSKFAEGNKWSQFPSGAFAWRISDEKFMKPIAVISNAKLRTSYGVTGNNRVSDYAYLSTITFPLSRYYTFENAYAIGAIPTTLGNKNLKWESTAQFDAGMDIAFFNNRISLTVDYYNKTTYDLLLNASMPSSTGYETGMKNIGKVRNRGWEFDISTANINNRNFSWNTSFNISFNRNKVLELTRNQETLPSFITWEGGYTNLPLYTAKLNQQMAQFIGYKWMGNYQYADFDQMPDGSYVLKANQPDNGSGRDKVQPGDIKYADIDGDGVVNANDRVVIGNPVPRFFGGLSNNFTWKGFDLNVFLQWSYGNEVANVNRLVFEGTSKLSLNQFASYADRWTPENQNNKLFRSKGYGPVAYSSRIIEDASYLRLRTVALGYTIPSAIVKKAGIRSARVYASAQNLLTWTNYSGLDPEVSTKNTALTPGFDFAAYPRAKTIVVGVNLSF